jgi:hypothetical protein
LENNLAWKRADWICVINITFLGGWWGPSFRVDLESYCSFLRFTIPMTFDTASQRFGRARYANKRKQTWLVLRILFPLNTNTAFLHPHHFAAAIHRPRLNFIRSKRIEHVGTHLSTDQDENRSARSSGSCRRGKRLGNGGHCKFLFHPRCVILAIDLRSSSPLTLDPE